MDNNSIHTKDYWVKVDMKRLGLIKQTGSTDMEYYTPTPQNPVYQKPEDYKPPNLFNSFKILFFIYVLRLLN